VIGDFLFPPGGLFIHFSPAWKISSAPQGRVFLTLLHPPPVSNRSKVPYPLANSVLHSPAASPSPPAQAPPLLLFPLPPGSVPFR